MKQTDKNSKLDYIKNKQTKTSVLWKTTSREQEDKSHHGENICTRYV